MNYVKALVVYAAIVGALLGAWWLGVQHVVWFFIQVFGWYLFWSIGIVLAFVWAWIILYLADMLRHGLVGGEPAFGLDNENRAEALCVGFFGLPFLTLPIGSAVAAATGSWGYALLLPPAAMLAVPLLRWAARFCAVRIGGLAAAAIACVVSVHVVAAPLWGSGAEAARTIGCFLAVSFALCMAWLLIDGSA